MRRGVEDGELMGVWIELCIRCCLYMDYAFDGGIESTVPSCVCLRNTHGMELHKKRPLTGTAIPVQGFCV